MSDVQILKAAQALLKAQGRIYQFTDVNETVGRHCALTALWKVEGRRENSYSASKWLYKVLEQDEGKPAYFTHRGSMVKFNDTFDRRLSEVLEVYDKAIALAEASGDQNDQVSGS